MSTETPFGRYTLIERVAVGGMAEIFLARIEGLGGFEKTLAIKRLHPQYSSDQQFVDMLIDEAKITVQLAHPNIVEIHDLGRIEQHFYIAMEYLEGRDLFHILKNLHDRDMHMPVEAAIYITLEILAGLHHAHFRTNDDGAPLHIIHRDVSPQNILVSYEGEVKLIDFGIAKAEQRLTATAAGVIKGKFYYMSPEQASGLELDHRSDIFSAAIVLYECLTASPLYDDDESGTLLTRVQKADIAPPSTLRTDVSPALERIVMRALDSDRELRHQSALELHQELGQYLVDSGSSYNRMHFALFMHELERENVASRRGNTDPSAVLPMPKSLEEGFSGQIELDSRPSVNPKSSLQRRETHAGEQATGSFSPAMVTQMGAVVVDDPALEERERRLRLALGVVLVAILLVCSAIAHVLLTTPRGVPTPTHSAVDAPLEHPSPGDNRA
jgi:serine/threonine protein kinase